MTTSWATYAARAGLDRLAVPGRGLDPGFVAGLEVDVVETVRQTGGDVWGIRAALDAVHVGLEWAAAGGCPECGSRGAHGRHSASCPGPWGLYGQQGPGVVIPLPEAS